MSWCRTVDSSDIKLREFGSYVQSYLDQDDDEEKC